MIRKRKRKQYVRPQLPLIVIFSEGEKTEQNYFASLRSHFKDMFRRKLQLKTEKSDYTDPIGIVNSAIEYIKEEEITMEGDSVWCFFDCDSNDNNSINTAVQTAQANNINIAFSNPSFELWVLLHYKNYSTAFISRQDALNEVKKYIPEYDKGMKDILSKIIGNGSLRKAIDKAARLESHHKGIGNTIHSTDSNPSTEVYKIFERLEIEEYLKK